METYKKIIFSRHSRAGAHMNSQHLRQNTQDLCNLEADNIPAESVEAVHTLKALAIVCIICVCGTSYIQISMFLIPYQRSFFLHQTMINTDTCSFLRSYWSLIGVRTYFFKDVVISRQVLLQLDTAHTEAYEQHKLFFMDLKIQDVKLNEQIVRGWIWEVDEGE